MLIQGKLYVRSDETYSPVLYELVGDKGIWNKLKITNITLLVQDPILFTGKTIEGGSSIRNNKAFSYYEFVYKTRVLYVMAIEYLEKI